MTSKTDAFDLRTLPMWGSVVFETESGTVYTVSTTDHSVASGTVVSGLTVKTASVDGRHKPEFRMDLDGMYLVQPGMVWMYDGVIVTSRVKRIVEFVKP